MDIRERIVKQKISIDEDLVLCVDDIVFEEDLKCKNISCEDSKKSFKVKGNIDAENIVAENKVTIMLEEETKKKKGVDQ